MREITEMRDTVQWNICGFWNVSNNRITTAWETVAVWVRVLKVGTAVIMDGGVLELRILDGMVCSSTLECFAFFF